MHLCFLWKPKEQLILCEGLLSIMKRDSNRLLRPFPHPSMADLQSHANLAAHNRNGMSSFIDHAFEKVLRKRQRCENYKLLPTSEARRHRAPDIILLDVRGLGADISRGGFFS